MPLTSDAGRNIAELTKVHGGEKDWPRKRIIAAGLNAARDRGGDVPRKHEQDSQRRALEKGY